MKGKIENMFKRQMIEKGKEKIFNKKKLRKKPRTKRKRKSKESSNSMIKISLNSTDLNK